MPSLSIVIPLFNEEKNLPYLNQRVHEVMKESPLEWELIYVDDGSTDKTLEILESLTGKDPSVRAISLTRNFGHQAALMAGLDHAASDAVITMDGDLQDPPELIPDLVKKWQEGYSVVYARRKNYRHDNLLKRWLSMLFYYLIRVLRMTTAPKNVGDFRLIEKRVLEELKIMRERTRYLRGMISWMGFSYAFVDYERPDRKNGKSGYSFVRLIRLAMDGFFSFSRVPLRIGLFLGISSIFIGLGFMVYMIADIIINDVYYHLYKLLVDIIFIFIGFLFILIWILGEYIGRIYHEVKGRNLYIVNRKINLEE
ncbi:MAG: glycosyltransferase family 2 protein [Bacteroidales bacterium]|nr:glycosyltransferase family 2 protein [Bacteroidales bacterium]